jgi:hypothetical protein
MSAVTIISSASHIKSAPLVRDVLILAAMRGAGRVNVLHEERTSSHIREIRAKAVLADGRKIEFLYETEDVAQSIDQISVDTILNVLARISNVLFRLKAPFPIEQIPIRFMDNYYPGSADGVVELGILEPNVVSNAVHEIGHKVYDRTIGHRINNGSLTMSSNFAWNCIYLVSLGDNLWQMLKDSSFIGSGSYGHPQDNASELFASAFHAFVMYPREFAERIQSADPKSEKFGKLVWLFMRDVIFNKHAFLGKDPFADHEFGRHISSLSASEVLDSWDKARGREYPYLTDLDLQCSRVYYVVEQLKVILARKTFTGS